MLDRYLQLRLGTRLSIATQTIHVILLVELAEIELTEALVSAVLLDIE